jgi:hypothetical protein
MIFYSQCFWLCFWTYHKQYDFSIHNVVHDFWLVHHACVRACASGLMVSIWFNRTPKPSRGIEPELDSVPNLVSMKHLVQCILVQINSGWGINGKENERGLSRIGGPAGAHPFWRVRQVSLSRTGLLR